MNIFEEINLNGTSSKDLQSLVNAINKNFQKVSSLPFLKGDKGTNVDIIEEPLVTINKITKKITAVTEFGKLVFAAYYGKEYTKEEKDTDDIFSKQSLRVLLDNSTGNKYLLIPQLLGKAYYVTGTYDSVNTKWNLERHNILPQIIYDKERDISTWEIDGINTGINANGEAGACGKSIRCWTANGITKPIGEYLNRIDIVNFYTPYFTLQNDPNKEYSTDTYINKTDQFYYYDADNSTQDLNDDTLKPADGDLVAIYLKKGLNDDKLTISIPNVVFGILRTDVSGQYYVIFNNNNLLSVGDLLSEYKIQNLLNHTGIHDDQDKPTDFTRGLYTYPKFNESPSESPHMFWATVDDKIVTRLGVLRDPDQVNSALTDPLLLKDGHPELHLEYPTTYLRNAIFTNEINDTTGYLKTNSVFSVDTSTDSKNNYLLTATNKNLIANFNNISNTNSSANSIKLSQDSVKFNTTDDLKAYIIPSFTIKYEQDSNNDLRIKQSKVVNLGGEYSFSLPYLGYKTETGKEIFNATQFTRLDKSTDPLKITLHEVELNHNGESSDNTGFGWRSFYDVDLLSSPCSYNSNGEACVYVGSSECDIINNSDKYKLKITVIQYRVAYNNDGTLYKYKSDTKSGSEYLKEANKKTLRTVTEVIYYLIDPGDTEKFNCLRYRLYFYDPTLAVEATNTIYIEPIKDETDNIIDATNISFHGATTAFVPTYWDSLDKGTYWGTLDADTTSYKEYVICDNNQHHTSRKSYIVGRLREIGYFPGFNNTLEYIQNIKTKTYRRGSDGSIILNSFLTGTKDTSTIKADWKNVETGKSYTFNTALCEMLPTAYSTEFNLNTTVKTPELSQLKYLEHNSGRSYFSLNQDDVDYDYTLAYLRFIIYRYTFYYDKNDQDDQYTIKIWDNAGKFAPPAYGYDYIHKNNVLGYTDSEIYNIVKNIRNEFAKPNTNAGYYLFESDGNQVKQVFYDWNNNVIKTKVDNKSDFVDAELIYKQQNEALKPLIELLKEKSELEYELVNFNDTTEIHTTVKTMQAVQPQYVGFKWVNGKFNDSENTLSGPGSGVLLPSVINSDSKTQPEFLYPLNKTTSLNSIEDFYNISFTTDETTNSLSNKGFLDITFGDYTLHKVCKDISINNKKVLTEEIPTSFTFADSNSTIKSNIDSVINTTINTGGLIPSTIKKA